jgi:two-component system, NarL family, sensor kinase
MTPFLALILGTLGMAAMASGVIIFIIKYQNKVTLHAKEKEHILSRHEIEILKASIHGEEIERNRIAQELHDDIAATLAISKMFFYKSQENQPLSEHLNKGIDILEESIEKIRLLSTQLSANLIDNKGLIDSIHSYTERLAFTLDISILIDQNKSSSILDAENQIHVFRIFQELLNNTIKYAKPSSIQLAIYPETDIILKLEHNGHGLIQNEFEHLIKRANGNGLANIHQRARLLNAHILFYQNNQNTFGILIRKF